jgi:hypothetical protein
MPCELIFCRLTDRKCHLVEVENTMFQGDAWPCELNLSPVLAKMRLERFRKCFVSTCLLALRTHFLPSDRHKMRLW